MSIRSRLRVRTRLRSAVHHIWPPKPKPLILMYHRIAEDPVDHWGLAVSPARFEEQLYVLRRTRHPFPLKEFVRYLLAGSLPSNAVALTFDDGYVDNLVAGKPRLAAADVPGTVFLTTGCVDGLGGFWWDELARRILLEKGPRRFELAVRGETLRFDIGAEPPVREGGFAELPRRGRAIWTIWQAIRRLEESERELVMAQLRSIFAGPKYRAWSDRVMTGAEVRALVNDGLVTIGAHTVTHSATRGARWRCLPPRGLRKQTCLRGADRSTGRKLRLSLWRLRCRRARNRKSGGFCHGMFRAAWTSLRNIRCFCTAAHPRFQLGRRHIRTGSSFGINRRLARRGSGNIYSGVSLTVRSVKVRQCDCLDVHP